MTRSVPFPAEPEYAVASLLPSSHRARYCPPIQIFPDVSRLAPHPGRSERLSYPSKTPKAHTCKCRLQEEWRSPSDSRCSSALEYRSPYRAGPLDLVCYMQLPSGFLKYQLAVAELPRQ